MLPAAEGIHEVREPLGDVRDDDRLAPLDHLAGGILGPAALVAHAEQFVDVRIAVAADDHQLVAVELLDAGTCIGDNFAQLRQNQIEDFGHAECAPERLGRRAKRLGLFAGGVLRREQPSVLDRDRGLGGECGRELSELFVVDVRLELVDADDADDTVADDHRRTDPAANASTAVSLTRESAGGATRPRRLVAASNAGPGHRGCASSSRSKPTPIRPPRSSKPRPLTITRRVP